MEAWRAAAALVLLAASLAPSAAAPVNEQTSLETLEDGSNGCYYNFQHYGEGDRIMTNEPCLNCTCHNRMLMCYLRVCPFTKPIGQDCTVEKRGDQCCPVITCPDVPVDLLTSTSTSSSAEYGSKDVGHLAQYGCTIENKFYSEGSKVPATPNKPCELCYCIRNMTACVMQECTLHFDGCTPVYHKDVCCPIRYSCDHEDEVPMLDDLTTTVKPTPGFLLTTTMAPGISQDCMHDEEVYADGALIKTDNACEHCYCMKGDIVCAVQECGTPMENEGKNCTALLPRSGQCCPDTYLCENDLEYGSTETDEGATTISQAENGVTTEKQEKLDDGVTSDHDLKSDDDYKPVTRPDVDTTTKIDEQSVTPVEEAFEGSGHTPEDVDTPIAKTTVPPIDDEEKIPAPTSSIKESTTSSPITDSDTEINVITDTVQLTTSKQIKDAEDGYESTSTVGAIASSDTETSTLGLSISEESTAKTVTQIAEGVPSEKDSETTETQDTPPSTVISVIEDVDYNLKSTTEAPIKLVNEIDSTTEISHKATDDSVTVTEYSDDKKAVTEIVEQSTMNVERQGAPITHHESENEIVDEYPGPAQILPHIPGEGDCLVDGVTYTNDSLIPSSNKCQKSCRCVSSIVKCENIECSPPPKNIMNCEPMYDSNDSCCPTYVCDRVKETIPPESDSQISHVSTEAYPSPDVVSHHTPSSEEKLDNVPSTEINQEVTPAVDVDKDHTIGDEYETPAVQYQPIPESPVTDSPNEKTDLQSTMVEKIHGLLPTTDSLSSGDTMPGTETSIIKLPQEGSSETIVPHDHIAITDVTPGIEDSSEKVEQGTEKPVEKEPTKDEVGEKIDKHFPEELPSTTEYHTPNIETISESQSTDIKTETTISDINESVTTSTQIGEDQTDIMHLITEEETQDLTPAPQGPKLETPVVSPQDITPDVTETNIVQETLDDVTGVPQEYTPFTDSPSVESSTGHVADTEASKPDTPISEMPGHDSSVNVVSQEPSATTPSSPNDYSPTDRVTQSLGGEEPQTDIPMTSVSSNDVLPKHESITEDSLHLTPVDDNTEGPALRPGGSSETRGPETERPTVLEPIPTTFAPEEVSTAADISQEQTSVLNQSEPHDAEGVSPEQPISAGETATDVSPQYTSDGESTEKLSSGSEESTDSSPTPHSEISIISHGDTSSPDVPKDDITIAHSTQGYTTDEVTQGYTPVEDQTDTQKSQDVTPFVSYDAESHTIGSDNTEPASHITVSHDVPSTDVPTKSSHITESSLDHGEDIQQHTSEPGSFESSSFTPVARDQEKQETVTNIPKDIEDYTPELNISPTNTPTSDDTRAPSTSNAEIPKEDTDIKDVSATEGPIDDTTPKVPVEVSKPEIDAESPHVTTIHDYLLHSTQLPVDSETSTPVEQLPSKEEVKTDSPNVTTDVDESSEEPQDYNSIIDGTKSSTEIPTSELSQDIDSSYTPTTDSSASITDSRNDFVVDHTPTTDVHEETKDQSPASDIKSCGGTVPCTDDKSSVEGHTTSVDSTNIKSCNKDEPCKEDGKPSVEEHTPKADTTDIKPCNGVEPCSGDDELTKEQHTPTIDTTDTKICNGDEPCTADGKPSIEKIAVDTTDIKSCNGDGPCAGNEKPSVEEHTVIVDTTDNKSCNGNEPCAGDDKPSIDEHTPKVDTSEIKSCNGNESCGGDDKPSVEEHTLKVDTTDITPCNGEERCAGDNKPSVEEHTAIVDTTDITLCNGDEPCAGSKKPSVEEHTVVVDTADIKSCKGDEPCAGDDKPSVEEHTPKLDSTNIKSCNGNEPCAGDGKPSAEEHTPQVDTTNIKSCNGNEPCVKDDKTSAEENTPKIDYTDIKSCNGDTPCAEDDKSVEEHTPKVIVDITDIKSCNEDEPCTGDDKQSIEGHTPKDIVDTTDIKSCNGDQPCSGDNRPSSGEHKPIVDTTDVKSCNGNEPCVGDSKPSAVEPTPVIDTTDIKPCNGDEPCAGHNKPSVEEHTPIVDTTDIKSCKGDESCISDSKPSIGEHNPIVDTTDIKSCDGNKTCIENDKPSVEEHTAVIGSTDAKSCNGDEPCAGDNKPSVEEPTTIADTTDFKSCNGVESCDEGAPQSNDELLIDDHKTTGIVDVIESHNQEKERVTLGPEVIEHQTLSSENLNEKTTTQSSIQESSIADPEISKDDGIPTEGTKMPSISDNQQTSAPSIKDLTEPAEESVELTTSPASILDIQHLTTQIPQEDISETNVPQEETSVTLPDHNVDIVSSEEPMLSSPVPDSGTPEDKIPTTGVKEEDATVTSAAQFSDITDSPKTESILNVEVTQTVEPDVVHEAPSGTEVPSQTGTTMVDNFQEQITDIIHPAQQTDITEEQTEGPRTESPVTEIGENQTPHGGHSLVYAPVTDGYQPDTVNTDTPGAEVSKTPSSDVGPENIPDDKIRIPGKEDGMKGADSQSSITEPGQGPCDTEDCAIVEKQPACTEDACITKEKTPLEQSLPCSGISCKTVPTNIPVNLEGSEECKNGKCVHIPEESKPETPRPIIQEDTRDCEGIDCDATTQTNVFEEGSGYEPNFKPDPVLDDKTKPVKPQVEEESTAADADKTTLAPKVTEAYNKDSTELPGEEEQSRPSVSTEHQPTSVDNETPQPTSLENNYSQQSAIEEPTTPSILKSEDIVTEQISQISTISQFDATGIENEVTQLDTKPEFNTVSQDTESNKESTTQINTIDESENEIVAIPISTSDHTTEDKSKPVAIDIPITIVMSDATTEINDISTSHDVALEFSSQTRIPDETVSENIKDIKIENDVDNTSEIHVPDILQTTPRIPEYTTKEDESEAGYTVVQTDSPIISDQTLSVSVGDTDESTDKKQLTDFTDHQTSQDVSVHLSTAMPSDEKITLPTSTDEASELHVQIVDDKKPTDADSSTKYDGLITQSPYESETTDAVVQTSQSDTDYSETTQHSVDKETSNVVTQINDDDSKYTRVPDMTSETHSLTTQYPKDIVEYESTAISTTEEDIGSNVIKTETDAPYKPSDENIAHGGDLPEKPVVVIKPDDEYQRAGEKLTTDSEVNKITTAGEDIFIGQTTPSVIQKELTTLSSIDEITSSSKIGSDSNTTPAKDSSAPGFESSTDLSVDASPETVITESAEFDVTTRKTQTVTLSSESQVTGNTPSKDELPSLSPTQDEVTDNVAPSLNENESIPSETPRQPTTISPPHDVETSPIQNEDITVHVSVPSTDIPPHVDEHLTNQTPISTTDDSNLHVPKTTTVIPIEQATTIDDLISEQGSGETIDSEKHHTDETGVIDTSSTLGYKEEEIQPVTETVQAVSVDSELTTKSTFADDNGITGKDVTTEKSPLSSSIDVTTSQSQTDVIVTKQPTVPTENIETSTVSLIDNEIIEGPSKVTSQSDVIHATDPTFVDDHKPGADDEQEVVTHPSDTDIGEDDDSKDSHTPISQTFAPSSITDEEQFGFISTTTVAETADKQEITPDKSMLPTVSHDVPEDTATTTFDDWLTDMSSTAKETSTQHDELTKVPIKEDQLPSEATSQEPILDVNTETDKLKDDDLGQPETSTQHDELTKAPIKEDQLPSEATSQVPILDVNTETDKLKDEDLGQPETSTQHDELTKAPIKEDQLPSEATSQVPILDVNTETDKLKDEDLGQPETSTQHDELTKAPIKEDQLPSEATSQVPILDVNTETDKLKDEDLGQPETSTQHDELTKAPIKEDQLPSEATSQVPILDVNTETDKLKDEDLGQPETSTQYDDLTKAPTREDQLPSEATSQVPILDVNTETDKLKDEDLGQPETSTQYDDLTKAPTREDQLPSEATSQVPILDVNTETDKLKGEDLGQPETSTQRDELTKAPIKEDQLPSEATSQVPIMDVNTETDKLKDEDLGQPETSTQHDELTKAPIKEDQLPSEATSQEPILDVNTETDKLKDDDLGQPETSTQHDELTKAPIKEDQLPSEATSQVPILDVNTETDKLKDEDLGQPETSTQRDELTKAPIKEDQLPSEATSQVPILDVNTETDKLKGEDLGQPETSTQRDELTKAPIKEDQLPSEATSQVPILDVNTETDKLKGEDLGQPETSTQHDELTKAPITEDQLPSEATSQVPILDVNTETDKVKGEDLGQPETSTQRDELTKAPIKEDQLPSEATSQVPILDVNTETDKLKGEDLGQPETSTQHDELTKAPIKEDQLPSEATSQVPILDVNTETDKVKGEDLGQPETSTQRDELTKAPIKEDQLPSEATSQVPILDVNTETDKLKGEDLGQPETSTQRDELTKAPIKEDQLPSEATSQVPILDVNTETDKLKGEDLGQPETSTQHDELTKAPITEDQLPSEATSQVPILDVNTETDKVKGEDLGQPETSTQRDELTKAPIKEDQLPSEATSQVPILDVNTETDKLKGEDLGQPETSTQRDELTKAPIKEDQLPSEATSQVPILDVNTETDKLKGEDLGQPETSTQHDELTKAPITEDQLPSEATSQVPILDVNTETDKLKGEDLGQPETSTQRDELTKAPIKEDQLPSEATSQVPILDVNTETDKLKGEDLGQPETSTQHDELTKAPIKEEQLPSEATSQVPIMDVNTETDKLKDEDLGQPETSTQRDELTKAPIKEDQLPSEATSQVPILDVNTETDKLKGEDLGQPETSTQHDELTKAPIKEDQLPSEATSQVPIMDVNTETDKLKDEDLGQPETSTQHDELTKAPIKEDQLPSEATSQVPILDVNTETDKLKGDDLGQPETSTQHDELTKVPIKEDQLPSEATSQVPILDVNTETGKLKDEDLGQPETGPITEVPTSLSSSVQPHESPITESTHIYTDESADIYTTHTVSHDHGPDREDEHVTDAPASQQTSSQEPTEFVPITTILGIPTTERNLPVTKDTVPSTVLPDVPITDMQITAAPTGEQEDNAAGEDVDAGTSHSVPDTPIYNEPVTAEASPPSTIKPDIQKPSQEVEAPIRKPEKPSKYGTSTSPAAPVELPPPEKDVDHQAPGYGSEEDYDEDQSFGPGTCRYGGKVFVSAQQIPRDDPCDFCFCFRSDIICLQQSCPPPIHGCHEEPISGFCCPRYECPVSMATTLNITTTTTTTTTTLPPHFLPHAYKGAAARRGCQIKGHSYAVGEVVKATSGPCLNCTCGGDGQMKCDPKVCTPEPMLRQMIAAAVSTKRRR